MSSARVTRNVAAWSFAVLLLPQLVAETLVVMGYRFGVVLAATRILSFSVIAQSSSSSTVGRRPGGVRGSLRMEERDW